MLCMSKVFFVGQNGEFLSSFHETGVIWTHKCSHIKVTVGLPASVPSELASRARPARALPELHPSIIVWGSHVCSLCHGLPAAHTHGIHSSHPKTILTVTVP